MYKKGISTIVATVLIVLITVAAVTILWAAISPLVGDNLAQSTNCLNVQNSVKVDTDRTYTHFNTTNEESVSVRVERGANSGDLVGLVISVESDGSTIGSWTFDSSAKFPSENGALVYDFDDGTVTTDDGDFTPNSLGSTVSASVAAQVLVDGVITTCEASGSVDVGQV